MATNPDAGSGARSPVIRQLPAVEHEGKGLLLKRQMPAVAISGLVHLVVIGVCIVGFRFAHDDVELKAGQTPTNTRIDEPPISEPDLTDPNVSLEVDLPSGVPDIDLKVEPPVIMDDPSAPNMEKEFIPPTTSFDPQFNQSLPNSPGGDQALVPSNSPGGFDPFRGRSGDAKQKRLGQNGGNDLTEAAVGRALVWLARQQSPGGYWEFDGSSKDERIAATGMCLLPFLAAGETHMTGKAYREHVRKGLDYLKSQLKSNGQFGGSGMYAQALATVAMCEAAGMTQDERLKKSAKLAVDFIVKAQAGNGSWGYVAGVAGDTSIVGWQVQALKSAKLAGISGVERSLKQAEAFLVSVSDESESQYGYASKGSTFTLSAVGLLSRIYISGNPRKAYVARGVKYLWDEHKPASSFWDMYYYYYATQVVFFLDGKDWHQNWNPAMQKLLLGKQITAMTDGAKSADIGSWPKDDGFIGRGCGKLGTTALACLTLEVYYRHMPLTKREAVGGLEVLDGKVN